MVPGGFSYEALLGADRVAAHSPQTQAGNRYAQTPRMKLSCVPAAISHVFRMRAVKPTATHDPRSLAAGRAAGCQEAQGARNRTAGRPRGEGRGYDNTLR